MKVLVTGGAGYIGGFMAGRLLDLGHEVTVVDSLERGHREAVDSRAEFVHGNLLDKNLLDQIFKVKFDGILHFAGFISMGESMENPYIYFNDNTMASLNLMEAVLKNGSNNLIFSSSAGVYGNPVKVPIPEDHAKNPENPYGESKLMVEKIMSWYGKTKNLNFAALRYFNASGAAMDGSRGENHDPESHIIPNIIKAVLNDKPFSLFGNDYKTRDGTCVRDYIHVLDLVEAHVLMLNKLQIAKGQYFYNVGTGNGYSNKEVVEMVEKISGRKVNLQISQRRPGDADELIADASRIKADLGFEPKYSNLEAIVESAWQWHSKQK